MSSPRPQGARPAGPRRPLPAGVYWRRRLFVLGLAFSLVFVIARWLGGSSDGSSDETPVAEQAGSQVEATETVTAGETPTAQPTMKNGKVRLAVPQGTCDPADIVITPTVAPGAEAGRDVGIRLSLQTMTTEACTWRVSRWSAVVRVSGSSEPVWSTQQCPRALPSEQVVVRRAVATVVTMTWDEARESRANCTRRAGWAQPGDYTITAAALGGEPTSAEFKLRTPAPRTVEVTVTPKPRPTDKPTKPVN